MTEIAETLAERDKIYGKYEDQAAIACKIKDAMYRGRNWPLAPDQREALEMIAVKMARILNGDPDCRDSWHDIAGYAQLVAKRLVK